MKKILIIIINYLSKYIISKNKLLQANYFNNLNNINNNNNTYMEIPNFNKILPYLQNINTDLPNNKKDLFYLFGISYFIDFTKLTNKIIDYMLNNIDKDNVFDVNYESGNNTD